MEEVERVGRAATPDAQPGEPVAREGDAGQRVCRREPRRRREEGEVGVCPAAAHAVADLDDAVGEPELLVGAVLEVHAPGNDGRDGCRERLGCLQAGEVVDDHRVDVGEVFEDVAR